MIDKQTLGVVIAVALVSLIFGGLAGTLLLVGLLAAAFVLTTLMRSIVGGSVPPALSHKVDQLTLFFFYTSMTRHSTDSPQPLLQSSSDRSGQIQFMRRLNQMPSFRLVSNVVATLGPMVCYPACAFFARKTAA